MASATDLPAAAKLAAFAVGSVLVFGAAFGLGRTVGPIGTDDPPAHPTHTDQPMEVGT